MVSGKIGAMKSALVVFVMLASVLTSVDDAGGLDAVSETDAGIKPCWHLTNQKFLSALVGLKPMLPGVFSPFCRISQETSVLSKEPHCEYRPTAFRF